MRCDQRMRKAHVVPSLISSKEYGALTMLMCTRGSSCFQYGLIICVKRMLENIYFFKYIKIRQKAPHKKLKLKQAQILRRNMNHLASPRLPPPTTIPFSLCRENQIPSASSIKTPLIFPFTFCILTQRLESENQTERAGIFFFSIPRAHCFANCGV